MSKMSQIHYPLILERLSIYSDCIGSRNEQLPDLKVVEKILRTLRRMQQIVLCLNRLLEV